MFDVLINKQLASVSAADREKAKAVAVPIAVRLLKERCARRVPGAARWLL
jgi:hypothetical protein